MARTPEEIYELIDKEQATLASLSGLDSSGYSQFLSELKSGSKVSDFKLFKWIMAVAQSLHEDQFDTFLALVEAKLAAARPGDLKWYRQKMLEFQYGDELTYIDGLFQYEQIDVEKRIIGHVAIEEDANNVVKIKCAHGDEDKTPLDAEEIAAAAFYVGLIKPPGVKTQVASLQGEWLKITADIYYDPTLVNSAGSAIEGFSNPAKDAIEAFLFNLPFTGILSLTDLEEAAMAAPGIKDCIITAAQKSAYSPVSFSNIGRYYTPSTGYMFLHGTSTLNYIESPV